MGVSAKVIADSKYQDTRLTTLEIELHRFILPEFLTHRMISRNFQSSRAVPVEKMIEQVRNDPAMPVHWGKNQSGMQAEEECNNLLFTEHVNFSREEAWENAAECAAVHAEEFNKSGYHKQIVNRLLEPFMWTKGVVTATEKSWNEFFKLRLHKDAQPEIYALAEKIKEAIDGSEPVELKAGEWHTPYAEVSACQDMSCVEPELKDKIKISASCCAQVSYRKLDDSLEKAKKVYDMLNLPVDGVYPEDPPHFSPTEHIAKAGDCDIEMSGNFHSTDFIQYRKVLEKGLEKEYIGEYND